MKKPVKKRRKLPIVRKRKAERIERKKKNRKAIYKHVKKRHNKKHKKTIVHKKIITHKKAKKNLVKNKTTSPKEESRGLVSKIRRILRIIFSRRNSKHEQSNKESHEKNKQTHQEKKHLRHSKHKISKTDKQENKLSTNASEETTSSEIEKNNQSDEEGKQAVRPESAEEKLARKKKESEEIKKLLTQNQGKEQQKESFFSKKKTRNALLAMFTTKTKVMQKDIDEALHQWELIVPDLSINDEIRNELKDRLYKSLKNIEVKKDKIEKRMDFAIRDAVSSLIPNSPDLISQIKSKKEPFIIIFVGPNDSGKTTFLAKIASLLQKSEISCILAAADTTKSESIDKLEGYAKKLDLPITKGEQGAYPVIIATEAKKYAKAHNIKCILIDTAGYASQEVEEIKEIGKITKTISPDLKIFVGESTTDQKAVEQSKVFNNLIGIDGIMLSKTDKQDESGAVISMSNAVKKPIYFLGTGEEIDDITIFDKEAFLKKLRLG